MKKITKLLVALIPVLSVVVVQGQNVNRISFSNMEQKNSRKLLEVPNIDGFVSLKGDFHIHTVFSDGCVWPGFRVDEAWADGLDAIAITDHDSYQPHGEALKGDQNSSYTIAKDDAQKKNIILIHAIEVTKWKMPPGHLNALFVTEGNIPELQDTSKAAFLTAMEKLHNQGAFILWNHPGWAAQQRDTTRWFDLHQTLLDKGWLNGIEVFNYNEWYPIALHWANTKKLAPFANSDIHEPMRWTYGYSDRFIRPITLIFAKERTEAGIKEAMLSQRTVAWFNDNLAGSEELLGKLFDRSLTIQKVGTSDKNTIYQITNPTDLVVELKSLSNGWKGSVTIDRRSSVLVHIPEALKAVKVEVTNWHVGLKTNLTKEIRLN